MEEIQKQKALIAELEQRLKKEQENLRDKLEKYVLDNIKAHFDEKIKFELEDLEPGETWKVGLLLPSPAYLDISRRDAELIQKIITFFENDHNKYEVIEESICENWLASVTFYDKEDKTDAVGWTINPKEIGFVEFPGFKKENDKPGAYVYFSPNDLETCISFDDNNYNKYVSKSLVRPIIDNEKVNYNDRDDPASFTREVYHYPILIMLAN